MKFVCGVVTLSILLAVCVAKPYSSTQTALQTCQSQECHICRSESGADWLCEEVTCPIDSAQRGETFHCVLKSDMRRLNRACHCVLWGRYYENILCTLTSCNVTPTNSGAGSGISRGGSGKWKGSEHNTGASSVQSQGNENESGANVTPTNSGAGSGHSRGGSGKWKGSEHNTGASSVQSQDNENQSGAWSGQGRNSGSAGVKGSPSTTRSKGKKATTTPKTDGESDEYESTTTQSQGSSSVSGIDSTTFRSITTTDLDNPDFICEPEAPLKLDCNTCWCSDEGNSIRYCTRIACNAKTYDPAPSPAERRNFNNNQNTNTNDKMNN